MKGIVDFRYFFDENIIGNGTALAEADLHGNYVKTVSNPTLQKYAEEINDKIVAVERYDDGIYVNAMDKNDNQAYDYIWGNYGYYYPYDGTITYVKSERMIKHLYKKFGEEFRDEYMNFCADVVGQFKQKYIEKNMRNNGGKIDQKALINFAENLYTSKMKNIDKEFNKLTGRNPEKQTQPGE